MTTQEITNTSSKKITLPRLFLHLEGIALLAGAALVYGSQSYRWWLFFVFLLTPDLVMLIYMVNKRAGEISYNLVHTTIFPLVLALYSGLSGNSLGLQIGLIWLAHIGMDRMVGYGFKYPGQFKETHFNRI